ncbi:Hypothetical predicted protein [Pelobates cultripes]|uniref:Uncharacterized protein n=1 Tax=Pelobates cultripes TaxID=61616 RepID=A0AAD1VTZ4_PELCU|nr:Hypothetical predicted protein [Pelobates cultripes]CAH2286053.1 Hypothetical predicted protein [Pelobates cultripes]
MGGGRKSKSGTAVAPIFKPRPDKEAPGMLSQQASDSDSETSTTSHKVDAPSAPLTKRDLKDMLTEMKSLVAEELTKHLAPLKEGLTDLTKRTQALENKMEEVTATTSTHEASIKELQEQFTYLEDMQEDLNNRSRRNNIRIRGLPEPSTPEALTAILHEAFSSLLPDASATSTEHCTQHHNSLCHNADRGTRSLKETAPEDNALHRPTPKPNDWSRDRTPTSSTTHKIYTTAYSGTPAPDDNRINTPAVHGLPLRGRGDTGDLQTSMIAPTAGTVHHRAPLRLTLDLLPSGKTTWQAGMLHRSPRQHRERTPPEGCSLPSSQDEVPHELN